MRNLRGWVQYYKEAVVKRAPLVVNRLGSGRMAVRNRFADLRRKIDSKTPTIVDGGANRGNVADIFLWLYPSCDMHLFEPHPECVRHLRKKYSSQPNVHIHAKALGPEHGAIEFYLARNEVSSSALPPSSNARDYLGDQIGVADTVSVEQVRLDEVLDTEVDILKLDLQGYELQALHGCGDLLKRTRAITVEIEFIPMYENQPLFGDIDTFLRGKGFRIFNVYELYTQHDGQLSAGDAVFLNTTYF